MQLIDSIIAEGITPCYVCGEGENCELSCVRARHGADIIITPDIIPYLDRQPQVMEKAIEIGRRIKIKRPFTGVKIQKGIRELSNFPRIPFIFMATAIIVYTNLTFCKTLQCLKYQLPKVVCACPFYFQMQLQVISNVSRLCI